MLEGTITGLMLVVAVIHLAPISGFFGADRLAPLYGIEITNPSLEILMRHRGCVSPRPVSLGLGAPVTGRAVPNVLP